MPICLGTLYDYRIWSEEPLTQTKYIAEVKGQVGVTQGQIEVSLLRNILRLSNLVKRIIDHIEIQ